MSAVKNDFIQKQVAEYEALRETYDLHDCSGGIDDGCDTCIKWFEITGGWYYPYYDEE